MVNYAHELAHLLSPAPFDLYGASNSSGDVPCYNWHMALQSCTRSDVADDSTSTYFMDPWHRGARYGWITIRANVILSGVSSGSQTLPPVGFGTSGLAESLELQGPNSESVTFEYRSSGANAYEDGVFRDGVIAWYRKAKTNGDPADIPSLQPDTTRVDKALFTLAPVGCKLNPNDIASRGMVAALTPGSYRLTWSNGADSGFLFTITPGFLSYVVSYSRTSAAPSC